MTDTPETQGPSPVGRPSKYKPEYCEAVEALGKEGKSQEQIAAELDVDPKSLRDWAEANPEFSLSLTRAKNFEQQWWEDVGQKALFADKFQAAVWTKSMSSRFKDKYTEKQTVNLGGQPGNPVLATVAVTIVDPDPKA